MKLKHRILLHCTSDYRGFGDSSPVELSESTVVSDARTALSWITKELGGKAKVLRNNLIGCQLVNKSGRGIIFAIKKLGSKAKVQCE